MEKSCFQQLFAIHSRRTILPSTKRLRWAYRATMHPRLCLSTCLIFRILYCPWGNNVPPEISMTVGVYGYDHNMEIKHFRAPRKMHTFSLFSHTLFSLPTLTRLTLETFLRNSYLLVISLFWQTYNTTRSDMWLKLHEKEVVIYVLEIVRHVLKFTLFTLVDISFFFFSSQ